MSRYTHTDWIDNPNYDPGADHSLPENLEKQTGFHKISVDSDMVSISVDENPDPYDDYGTEHWQVSIPHKLAVNGSDKDIHDWFFDHFKVISDRQKINNISGMLYSIFDVPKEIIVALVEDPRYNGTETEHQSKINLIDDLIKNLEK